MNRLVGMIVLLAGVCAGFVGIAYAFYLSAAALAYLFAWLGAPPSRTSSR